LTAVDTVRVFEIVFAAGVVVALATLGAALLGQTRRRFLLGAATLVSLGAAGAWAAFALDPGEHLALAAGGLTVAAIAAVAAIPLRRALERGRRIESEIVSAEERLRATVAQGAVENARELERLLARSRADSVSLLADEERRIGDERRRFLAEREREAGGTLAQTLEQAEHRVERRLAGWADDVERLQRTLAEQMARLDDRQKALIAEAEARIAADVDRLESSSDEQRVLFSRLREDLGKAAQALVQQSNAELEAHAAERRRALHDLGDRLRRRERELTERVAREESEALQRLQAGFADVERRVVEQLQRAAERDAGRYAEAAGVQFEGAIRTAREDAAKRLSRELDRAIETFARQASTLLAERLAHVGDSGAQRLEKRMNQVAAGLERQREEIVAALEQRLAETETEFRRHLQGIAVDAETERTVIESRLQELARRVDDSIAQTRERLAALDELRVR
jgi:hypothetical protein